MSKRRASGGRSSDICGGAIATTGEQANEESLRRLPPSPPETSKRADTSGFGVFIIGDKVLASELEGHSSRMDLFLSRRCSHILIISIMR